MLNKLVELIKHGWCFLSCRTSTHICNTASSLLYCTVLCTDKIVVCCFYSFSCFCFVFLLITTTFVWEFNNTIEWLSEFGVWWSFFIGPEANHCHWLTDSLPNSCLVDLIHVTLACQLKTCWHCYCCWYWCWETCWRQFGIWYRFGSLNLVIKLKFCSDFEHKVWSRFWIWSSGEILKLKLGQYFAADVWSRLWSWILVKILKLGLFDILNFKFSRDNDV